MTETVPDETTLCQFLHYLAKNGLNKLFFDAANRVMVQTGHMMKGGTIVAAMIISAPSSAQKCRKSPRPGNAPGEKGKHSKRSQAA